jgi:putative DNA-invertase from lambdoid prophage Rac
MATKGLVFGYCRVSTSRQVEEGESLEVQQRQIEGWCHQHGRRAESILIEEGVSGSVPLEKRPKGTELLKLASAGDTIVAAKLDRLFRSALDALNMVDRLKRDDVSLVLLDLGGDISGNGISKLFLTIAAAFAEAERDRLRERISQVKQDQARRGRFLGGARPPFGWRVDGAGQLVEERAEQKAIARMVQLRNRRVSLRKIAETVTKDTGLQVSHETVRQALERTTQRKGS